MARRFKLDWTPRFRADRLDIPLRTRKPAVWAVWNDLFHTRVSNEQIAQAFGVMATAKRHYFMVLTKRPRRMGPFVDWIRRDTRAGFCSAWPPPNVALGVTVESQEHVHRVGALLEAWPGLTFLSVEPMLGPVDIGLYGVNLVIAGGESGPGARPMDLDWARRLRDQCAAAGAPFLLKQIGPDRRSGRALDGREHNGWFGDKA